MLALRYLAEVSWHTGYPDGESVKYAFVDDDDGNAVRSAISAIAFSHDAPDFLRESYRISNFKPNGAVVTFPHKQQVEVKFTPILEIQGRRFKLGEEVNV